MTQCNKELLVKILQRTLFITLLIPVLLIGILFSFTLLLPYTLRIYCALLYIRLLYMVINHCIFPLCGISCSIQGKEHLSIAQQRPVIYASTHQSSWDILFLAFPRSKYNDSSFFFKKELSKHFLRYILIKLLQIPIDRENPRLALKTIEKYMEKILKWKKNIVIFPQGKRSNPCRSEEDQPSPLKLLGLNFVHKTLKYPVIPVIMNPRNLLDKFGLPIGKTGTITVQFFAPTSENCSSNELKEYLTHTLLEEGKRLDLKK